MLYDMHTGFALRRKCFPAESTYLNTVLSGRKHLLEHRAFRQKGSALTLIRGYIPPKPQTRLTGGDHPNLVVTENDLSDLQTVNR